MCACNCAQNTGGSFVSINSKIKSKYIYCLLLRLTQASNLLRGDTSLFCRAETSTYKSGQSLNRDLQILVATNHHQDGDDEIHEGEPENRLMTTDNTSRLFYLFLPGLRLAGVLLEFLCVDFFHDESVLISLATRRRSTEPVAHRRDVVERTGLASLTHLIYILCLIYKYIFISNSSR